ncbi:MAG: polyketide synthase dehydratase domain-containing protein [Deltaproteobacteria bacterium]|nr:polyketide synthase dehydratase domain-containing protein [Deltaproteobacteria bacterium]
MEHLPKITKSVRLPLDIPGMSYLQDHCFEQTAVLPAVEACELLALAVKNELSGAEVSSITKAEFNKFLFLEPSQKKAASFCDLALYENNDVRASLVTKRKGRKSAISRTMEHASVVFGQKERSRSAPSFDKASVTGEEWMEIPAQRVYDELVLFGPSYRNIRDVLSVSRKGAIAKIKAPAKPGQNNTADILGSPFVLDAAFHAACVWGQRFHCSVRFPVGFERRVIHKKTKPHTYYVAMVIPRCEQKEEILFDIWIFDKKGELFESTRGVKMRDVSRGRIKPPEWITLTGESG